MRNSCKLGLGTVQWGLSYGVSNSEGQTPILEVKNILKHANETGINMLDTAYAYGNAEVVIGTERQQTRKFKIVTKTRPINHKKKISQQDILFVIDGFRRSLEHMYCSAVHGLLVHNADSLLVLGGDELWKALQRLKELGKVEKLGVSVYHPEQLERILDNYSIDLVQLPLNIYDQRFSVTGLLRKLRQRGVEIHVRSAFLQGLLLLPPDELSDYFVPIRGSHTKLHAYFNDNGLTPLEGCLQFCLNHEDVDRVIVGCENKDQLNDIILACESHCKLKQSNLLEFSTDDNAFINPLSWLQ